MERILRAFRYVRELEADIDQLCGELDDVMAEIKALKAGTSPAPESIGFEDTNELPKGANREQAANIIFYMKMRDVTQYEIADLAGVGPSMVNQVIHGMRTSGRVQSIIAMALGFSSWSALTAGRKGVAA